MHTVDSTTVSPGDTMPAPTALDHLVNAWASDLSPDVTSQQLYDLAVRYGLLPHLCRGISNEGTHADKVKWGVWLKAQPLATRILSGRKLYRCPKPSAPDVLAVRLLRPDVRDAIASMAAHQNVTREQVISSVLAEYWGLDLD